MTHGAVLMLIGSALIAITAVIMVIDFLDERRATTRGPEAVIKIGWKEVEWRGPPHGTALLIVGTALLAFGAWLSN